MNIERTLETQRHRLLRIVAGLLIVIGVLAIGPVSRRFSDWTLGFVLSVLPRLEAAVRYLAITQACLSISREGLDVDRHRFAASVGPEICLDVSGLSLAECRARLRAFRAVLRNLPRHALRLLRRSNASLARASDLFRHVTPPRSTLSSSLDDWRLIGVRVERPPDKRPSAPAFMSPPPVLRREASVVG